ncbi:MAG: hypothetical protein VX258_00445 [Pseudomonadota bacterium]|uniref:hypothetical protein n=1 Tax=Alcanivorax sp. TaxID=1872427 RepID=UPI0025BEDA44|nr:hypothetical protein [Alcanivorax sp.]MEE3319134.1 hypothetical protein [Pseudomonadota bacterium]
MAIAAGVIFYWHISDMQAGSPAGYTAVEKKRLLAGSKRQRISKQPAPEKLAGIRHPYQGNNKSVSMG